MKLFLKTNPGQHFCTDRLTERRVFSCFSFGLLRSHYLFVGFQWHLVLLALHNSWRQRDQKEEVGNALCMHGQGVSACICHLSRHVAVSANPKSNSVCFVCLLLFFFPGKELQSAFSSGLNQTLIRLLLERFWGFLMQILIGT